MNAHTEIKSAIDDLKLLAHDAHSRGMYIGIVIGKCEAYRDVNVINYADFQRYTNEALNVPMPKDKENADHAE